MKYRNLPWIVFRALGSVHTIWRYEKGDWHCTNDPRNLHFGVLSLTKIRKCRYAHLSHPLDSLFNRPLSRHHQQENTTTLRKSVSSFVWLFFHFSRCLTCASEAQPNRGSRVELAFYQYQQCPGSPSPFSMETITNFLKHQLEFPSRYRGKTQAYAKYFSSWSRIFSFRFQRLHLWTSVKIISLEDSLLSLSAYHSLKNPIVVKCALLSHDSYPRSETFLSEKGYEQRQEMLKVLKDQTEQNQQRTSIEHLELFIHDFEVIRGRRSFLLV